MDSHWAMDGRDYNRRNPSCLLLSFRCPSLSAVHSPQQSDHGKETKMHTFFLCKTLPVDGKKSRPYMYVQCAWKVFAKKGEVFLFSPVESIRWGVLHGCQQYNAWHRRSYSHCFYAGSTPIKFLTVQLHLHLTIARNAKKRLYFLDVASVGRPSQNTTSVWNLRVRPTAFAEIYFKRSPWRD